MALIRLCHKAVLIQWNYSEKKSFSTVSAPIERWRSINFWALQTGVLFEFGQGGALFKLALYLLIYEQHLANFLFLILAS